MVKKEENGSSPDRVWFSEGMKINLGNYQSYDVGAGMTTDVREGETPEQAYARCRKATRAQLESRAAKVQRGMYDHLLNTPSESE
jgi:hypothetical protein